MRNKFLVLTQGQCIFSGGSKGGAGDACPPQGPKFFQFHTVFGKIWQNCMLVPPWGVGAPSSGKSWIRYCILQATQWKIILFKISHNKVISSICIKWTSHLNKFSKENFCQQRLTWSKNYSSLLSISCFSDLKKMSKHLKFKKYITQEEKRRRWVSFPLCNPK